MFRTLAALLVLTLTLPALAQTTQPAAKRDIGPSKKLGWRLGTQCYTFRDRSLYETMDTAKSLGLRYLELYPGQKLSADADAKFNHDSPAEQRTAVKQKLKDM